MKRKLASIERIVEIKEIPNADNIERITIKGWHLVAKKGEFSVGDLCIYIEIDSFLPVGPKPYEFLRTSNYFKTHEDGSQGFRIKTIRLRKQISQGIAFPLNLLSELAVKPIEGSTPIEGDDITEVLGVKLWTPKAHKRYERKHQKSKNPILKWVCNYKIGRSIVLPLIRKPKKSWPHGISKTDEERVQNMTHLFKEGKVRDYFKDKIFYTTEKIDYQSATYFTMKEKYLKIFNKQINGVCSRNVWKKQKDNSLYWKIFRKYNFANIFKDYKGHKLVIQGEQGDTNVQGNKYKIDKPTMWIFNIILDDYQFNYPQMFKFCEDHNLDIVPLIHDAIKLPETIDETVELSRIKSTLNPKIHCEGLVWRYIKDGKKIMSFKVLNPDFLLRYDS